MEIAETLDRVLLTSITKAGPERNISIRLLEDFQTRNFGDAFISQNPLYLLKNIIQTNKYQGLSVDELQQAASFAEITIFEADGARNLSLKAHNDFDPVVPSFATHVVILIGSDAVNTRINDGFVHRKDLFCSKWNLTYTDILTPEIISTVVTHPKGYLSKVKTNIPIIYFINKAGAYYDNAKMLAESIRHVTTHPVYYGSIQEKWWKSVK